MKKYLFLLYILCCNAVCVWAAADSYSFKHITMDMGLSHNQINDIYRDSKGFMWFSTASGLNRYDGYEIKVFLHTSDPTSIPGNYVEWCHDLTGEVMLVKTNTFYALFDKCSETFSPVDALLFDAGVSTPVTCVYADDKSNLWMACDSLCYVYSYDKGALLNHDGRSMMPYNGRVVSFSVNGDSMLIVYEDGTIVRCTNGCSFDVESVIKAPVTKGRHFVFVDRDGDYWMRTVDQKGVCYYDVNAGKWHNCSSSDDSYYQISDYNITGVAEDGSGHIWIVSDHGGVNVVDKTTHGVTNILSRKNDERSIASNGIKCIYYDSEGIMWVGDVRAGISLYNESMYKFDVDMFNYEDVEKQFAAQVNTIEEDRTGNMWYGSNSHGLLYVNSSSHQRRLFRHSANNNSIPSDIIVDLLADSKGNLWIGTYLGGLCRYDGNRFVSYKDMKDVPAVVSSENIWVLAADADDNIWVGSLGNGVARYDAQRAKWTEYHISESVHATEYISQIFPVKDGRVYFGTAAGVYVLDAADGAFVKVHSDGMEGLDSENINDIYVDSRNLLWIGTREGLYVYETKNFRMISSFSVENGLPYDAISGIIEDSDKNMWVTTIRGITNIIVNPNPRSEEYAFSIYNYNEQDGFLKGAVNIRAIKKTSYGEIIVGGDPGIVRFRPDKIKYNKETPVVCFTGISVFGKPVNLPCELPYCNEISLDYSDNMFSVSFSTLSCLLPEKVSYSYMLEGFNNQWINADGHSVSYTNLAPGRYVLKVRAANCDGFSDDTASELVIRILPPWWRTIGAYVAYVLLVVLMLFLIRLQISRREKEKYRLKQIEAEVQKRHEVDEVKLSFFTNISHELRTPLSLIISPVENLISNTNDATLKNKLELIHRNAQKLLNMVNQLLDFRKADVNGMQINMSEGDLVAFVKQSSQAFFELSERSVKCEFSSAVDSLRTEFDRDKIAKVMNNLLSNAFKFTPDEGRIDVWVGLSADGKQAIIKVSDTGIGIDDVHKEHIFERFYQVPQTDSSLAGSGIGLHLVKEFVSMHNGTVAVGDNVGHGTVFAVMLPVIRSEESVDVVDDEASEVAMTDNGKPQILVVDDNADFRDLLSDTLEDMFDVKQAKDGREAWTIIEKSLPDLVIADVMMPVVDGNELCRMIKNDVRTSHIPVIMLTAMTATEHKIEGLTNGADDYLTKPFNPQILRLRINKLIELGKKRQTVFKHQIDPEPSEITITPLDEKLIQKAIQYVEDNISDTELSVEGMSRNLGMSRVHLYKKLLTITGRSPIEFIRVIRLKRAAQLLRDKQQNVSDVAYAVGFNNPKYFSRYFKEEFGVLPSVYQNSADTVGTSFNMDKL